MTTLRHPSIDEMHPGELLREEVVPALGISKAEIARHLGVSRQTLYDLLLEKQGVTAEMALRIGKLCGNGPEFWMELQGSYDLWRAQERICVNNIPTLEGTA